MEQSEGQCDCVKRVGQRMAGEGVERWQEPDQAGPYKGLKFEMDKMQIPPALVGQKCKSKQKQCRVPGGVFGFCVGIEEGVVSLTWDLLGRLSREGNISAEI